MSINEYQEFYYKQRIGQVYGCFEVTDIQYDPVDKRQEWEMRCVYCGTVKYTKNGKDFVKGKNKGICKCQHTKHLYSEKPQKTKKAQYEVYRSETHKERKRDHPLYSRWKSIKRRCYNKSDKDYPNYGGRGVVMCDEWKRDFWSFVEWAEVHGYRKELTIDRIDNNRGYSPQNCRWVSRYEQNQNKRDVETYEGMTLPDWCLEHDVNYNTVSRLMHDGLGIKDATERAAVIEREREFNNNCVSLGVRPSTIKSRMSKGLTFQEAIAFKGNCHQAMYEIDGVRKPLLEWCEEYHITAPAVMYRVKTKGMNFEEALTTPKYSK